MTVYTKKEKKKKRTEIIVETERDQKSTWKRKRQRVRDLSNGFQRIIIQVGI